MFKLLKYVIPTLFLVFVVVYANHRTLKFDSLVESSAPSFEITTHLPSPKIFLEFRTSPAFLVLVLFREGAPVLKTSVDPTVTDFNSKNFLMGRLEELPPGRYQILTETSSSLPDLKEVRVEYRQTSVDFLTKAIRHGDQRFLFVGLGLLVMALCLFGFLKFAHSALLYLGFTVALAQVWLLSPPMSGFDDITHFPGMLYRVSGTDLPTTFVESTRLIKDSHYMELNGLSTEQIQHYRSQKSFCPQELADPSLSLEQCPYSVSPVHDVLVWWHRRLINNADPFKTEALGKAFNQINIFFFIFVMALYASWYYTLSFWKVFGAALLSLLVPYYFLPHTMGVGTDFYLFSSTGLVIVFLHFALSRRPWLAFLLTLASLPLANHLISKIDTPDYKRILIFYPVLCAFLIFALQGRSKKTNWLFKTVALVCGFLILYVSNDQLMEWFQGLPHPVKNFSDLFTNLAHTDYGKLLSTMIRTLSGTLITNKAALIPPLMYMQFVLLFLVGGMALRFISRHYKEASTSFLLLLVISIPGGLFFAGAILNDMLWVFPRYTYPFWGAFFFAVSLWGSSDTKHLRTLMVVAMTVQIVAIMTMLIPNYWMKLGFYP
ncbi:MAG: hypothetical protein AB7F59_07385 [Bdellovibrionales bacterium]